jgi:hypothetical protein
LHAAPILGLAPTYQPRHDPVMVEYGNGISKGPAGQVGGGGQPLGNGGDPFANASQLVNDGWSWLSHLSTVELVVVVAVVFLGLLILRKAL